MRVYHDGLRWPTLHFRRYVTAQKYKISKVQQLDTTFISEQWLFSCPRQSCCVRAQGREMVLQSVGSLNTNRVAGAELPGFKGFQGTLPGRGH